MRVRTDFDPESVLEEAGRDAEVGGVICFQHEGISYPDPDWNDFGVRLLSFWIQQILNVSERGASTVEFVFLDGNFSLSGALDDRGILQLVPENAAREFSWRLAWEEVERAIIEAAEDMVAWTAELGVRPRGIEGLEAGLRALAARTSAGR